MNISEDYCFFKLKEEFANRQRSNPHYSLRAYARDLNIDSSNLSAILKKKRKLPIKRAASISKKLGLLPVENQLFLLGAIQNKTKLNNIEPNKEIEKKYLLEDIYHKVIAEWEYYAILNLINTTDFKSQHSWIAGRLDVSEIRVDIIMNHLIELGLVKLDKNNNYVRLTPRLQTSEDVTSQALRKAHKDAIELGLKKIDEESVEDRDFSSMTIAINPNRLKEAKAIIREFQDKLEALFDDDEKKEVYLFSTQFFPLTKKKITRSKP